MNRRHAVITGSLHNGNLGDYALLKAFVGQHKNTYKKLTLIGPDSQNLLDVEHTIFPQQPMAIGYRFWKGYKERTKTRRMIVQEMPDAMRHYIWLGGILGSNIYHNRGRYKELNWASSFCNTLIYYFGDVEPGFNSLTEATKLAKKMNRCNRWIAVRSNEAANLLVDAGLRSKINVGIDPALYDRCKRWGIPFTRYKKDANILAIVVCKSPEQKCLGIWKAAALSAIKLGIKIRWVSLCDSEDLGLCQQLFREFSDQHPNHPMDIVSGMNGESGIAEASICVSTRFHGTIFGLTAGVPTIAIPYGAKIKRLFEFLNLEDWVANPISNDQNNVDWNSIIHEMITSVIQGRWQPDYRRLNAGIKAHQKALYDLELSISDL
jgi:hypothetical protein